jgi:small subunit ribosomal protein S17
MHKRKEFTGVVLSSKMQKTCIVKVMRVAKHPKYKRIIRKFNKFKVHDEKSLAKAGDLVCIQEARPLSKDKYFRLKAVLKPAAQTAVLKEGI